MKAATSGKGRMCQVAKALSLLCASNQLTKMEIHSQGDKTYSIKWIHLSSQVIVPLPAGLNADCQKPNPWKKPWKKVTKCTTWLSREESGMLAGRKSSADVYMQSQSLRTAIIELWKWLVRVLLFPMARAYVLVICVVLVQLAMVSYAAADDSKTFTIMNYYRRMTSSTSAAIAWTPMTLSPCSATLSPKPL